MKYGGVVVLMMTGAILYSAVNLEVQTVDIHMICLILLVAGIIGLTSAVIGDASTRRRGVVPVQPWEGLLSSGQ